MNTFLRDTFLQEPSPRSAAFRYGGLAVILALFAFVLYHPGKHYWRELIASVMLLLNHLAFQFRWPRGLMIALRVIAIASVVCGCIYIFTR
jgi:hypothetical protein